MQSIRYGRKTFQFSDGVTTLTATSVTEKAIPGEDETAFTQRILKNYQGQRGTIEVVFKNGRPDYAIINFS